MKFVLMLALLFAMTGLVFLSNPTIQPVRAGMITVMAGSQGGKHNELWTIQWPDALDKVLSFQDMTRGNDGKNPITPTELVLKTVEFGKDLKRVVVTFKENQEAKSNEGGSAAGTSPDAGLFFNITETIKNKSGVSWPMFTEELADNTMVDKSKGTGVHVAFPHFHDAGFARTGGSTPLRLITPETNEGVAKVVFGDGKAVPGDGSVDFKIKGRLAIHEIEVKGMQRTFDLVETPSPEPATLVTAMAGTIALLGYALRHRIVDVIKLLVQFL